ncbi:cytochrome P450 [Xylariaceae sp. FL1651]|nr:cytochrome P450 [Xylariaceae sp. FL1651]
MSAPNIHTECIMTMLAVSETIPSVFMWFSHPLMIYPETLRHAVEEVRGVFGPDHLILNQDVLAHLPYVEAAVSEVLRISPTTAGLTLRIPPSQGFELQGHCLLVGIEIHVNLRSVNMHDKTWNAPL